MGMAYLIWQEMCGKCAVIIFTLPITVHLSKSLTPTQGDHRLPLPNSNLNNFGKLELALPKDRTPLISCIFMLQKVDPSFVTGITAYVIVPQPEIIRNHYRQPTTPGSVVQKTTNQRNYNY